MKRTLTLVLLSAAGLTSWCAAAIMPSDSPAMGQAQTLLEQSGTTVYDGSSRKLSTLSTRAPQRSLDDDSTLPPSPGPRMGGPSPDLAEPANPMPKPEPEQSQGSGLLGSFNMKTLGFAAGGALLGVGIALLLGWGWLGIAALAVGGAVAGWFGAKMF